MGAYFSYWLEQRFHVDLFVGLLITIPTMFVFGVLLEWAFIRRLKWDRVTLSVLVTFAIALIIEGTLGYIFTTNMVILHGWYVDAAFPIGTFYINYIYLFAFLQSVVLSAQLFFLAYRTSFGGRLRASMQNRTSRSVFDIVIPT